jgi:Tfp pilus assembly protein PilX
MNTSSRPPRPAHGFALVSALVLMTGLLVLAAVTLRVSTRNERMAGIDLDRALAFQLAEATLRDAQQDIMRMSSTGTACTTNCRPATDFPNKDTGLTGVSYLGICRQGMCYLGPGSVAPSGTNEAGSAYLAAGFVNPWDRPDPGESNPTRPYARYGEFTNANWTVLQQDTGAARRPRYWVEVIVYGAARDRYLYRITVQATGRSADTVAMLQEVYQPF